VKITTAPTSAPLQITQLQIAQLRIKHVESLIFAYVRGAVSVMYSRLVRALLADARLIPHRPSRLIPLGNGSTNSPGEWVGPLTNSPREYLLERGSERRRERRRERSLSGSTRLAARSFQLERWNGLDYSLATLARRFARRVHSRNSDYQGIDWNAFDGSQSK